MDFYTAVENRRTIRKYAGKATEEQLVKIIRAGTKAPSAVNRQPWEFILVDDPDLVDRLADIKYGQTLAHPPGDIRDDPGAVSALAESQRDAFSNASIVAICHLAQWERSVWMCLENMSLAVTVEGLGSCITLYWDDGKSEAETLLGLPEAYELTAILKVGVPAEEGYARDENPFAPRRPDLSWLHRNRF